VPDLQGDVESLFQEIVDGLSVFYLNLCESSLVCDRVLWVFSVANLVVLEEALDFTLHVACEGRVVCGPNSPSEHLIQVEGLQINLLLLAFPLFSDCDGKGS